MSMLRREFTITRGPLSFAETSNPVIRVFLPNGVLKAMPVRGRLINIPLDRVKAPIYVASKANAAFEFRLKQRNWKPKLSGLRNEIKKAE